MTHSVTASSWVKYRKTRRLFCMSIKLKRQPAHIRRVYNMPLNFCCEEQILIAHHSVRENQEKRVEVKLEENIPLRDDRHFQFGCKESTSAYRKCVPSSLDRASSSETTTSTALYLAQHKSASLPRKDGAGRVLLLFFRRVVGNGSGSSDGKHTSHYSHSYTRT
jgi:hypothetical protein